MPTLHDSSYRTSIAMRLQALRPDAQRHWGKMRVDQMLWHVNESLEQSLGRLTTTRSSRTPPLPSAVLRFVVINLPWPKGRAPTSPELVARDAYDFEAERTRALRLIEELASRDLNASWPKSATFGQTTGLFWSRLQAKHLDHHLKQFGV
jgi:DinB family protein